MYIKIYRNYVKTVLFFISKREKIKILFYSKNWHIRIFILFYIIFRIIFIVKSYQILSNLITPFPFLSQWKMKINLLNKSKNLTAWRNMMQCKHRELQAQTNGDYNNDNCNPLFSNCTGKFSVKTLSTNQAYIP